MKRSKLLISAMILSVFFATCVPVAVAQSPEIQSNQTKNVEQFDIITLALNSDGVYVPSGYKTVTAISTIETQGAQVATNVSVVEDYYDLNNNFINSQVKHEEFQNNLNTGEAKVLKQNKTFVKAQNTAPTVITTVASAKITADNKFHLFTLTDGEKDNLEKKVNEIVQTLDKGQLTDTKGVTQVDIDKVKATVAQLQTRASALSASSSVAMAGAYDNYYNYDYSTGNYLVQTLSAQAHNYLRYTGSTSGNSTASNSFNTFKGYIDNYEQTTQTYMDGATMSELVGWAFTLAALITMVTGFASGPVGWIAIVSYYGGALATFGGYTSTAYATVSRLNLSQVAAQYLSNARTINFNGGTYWPNSSLSVVTGF